MASPCPASCHVGWSVPGVNMFVPACPWMSSYVMVRLCSSISHRLTGCQTKLRSVPPHSILVRSPELPPVGPAAACQISISPLLENPAKVLSASVYLLICFQDPAALKLRGKRAEEKHLVTSSFKRIVGSASGPPELPADLTLSITELNNRGRTGRRWGRVL